MTKDKRKEKKEARKTKTTPKKEPEVTQEELELQRAAKAGPPREDWEKLEDMSIKKADKVRRVTVIQDHILNFPELWLTVYIPEKTVEPMFAEMFTRASCYQAKNIDEADLVVFTGGPDVDPLLYHEKPHPKTDIDVARDKRDIELYVECYRQGVPMLGICRGAQFLHVMNGGKLWQHVDGHHGPHSMRAVGTNITIDRISSTHHQMVRPHNGMQVLALAHEAKEKWASPTLCTRMPTPDIEAFFYRDTCCLGIQGHPEYKGYNRFTQWCLLAIEHNLRFNPDLELMKEKGVYRMKPDLIQERATIRSGTKEKQ